MHFVIGDGCFPAGHRAEVRLFEARQSQFLDGATFDDFTQNMTKWTLTKKGNSLFSLI